MLQQKVQPATRSKEDSAATWKDSVTTQSSVLAIQGKTTLLRQQIHATARNTIETKKSLSRHKLRITTERMSQHSRDCCNKVEGLKEEIFVVTKDNHVPT